MRLIDADALLGNLKEYGHFSEDDYIVSLVKDAPTFQREGWKLVPFRDDLITEEMKRALFRNLIHADDEVRVIKAIIAAAPTDTE